MILIAALLSVISKSNSQVRPSPTTLLPTFPTLRPLCLSQFALVNHACSILPYTPTPPPASPASPAPPSPATPVEAHPLCPNKSSHRHGHHHRHSHSSSCNSRISAAEDECCRWLKEVDAKCVCDLLVHLPVFLAKPAHNYTVVVSDECSVTYQCPSRMLT